MSHIAVTAGPVERSDTILTPDALDFLAELQTRFGARRDELLQARRARRSQVSSTGRLDFLPETREVRDADWQVAPAPEDLRDRRVEITGPTERKMAINALNSGAKVWLADLEVIGPYCHKRGRVIVTALRSFYYVYVNGCCITISGAIIGLESEIVGTEIVGCGSICHKWIGFSWTCWK
jgi:malate synthase